LEEFLKGQPEHRLGNI